MAKTRAEHLVACDGSNPEYPFGFACLHCGAKEPVQTPLSIDAFVERMKNFERIHAHCPPPAEKAAGT